MKLVFTLFCFFFLGFTTADASAYWMNVPSSDFSVPPPPKENSARYKKDFELLHKYQKRRTKEQCALANRQRFPTYEKLFSGLESLPPAEFGKTQWLMEDVIHFSERVADYFKNQYERPRPYETDETLEPCIYKPGGEKSYPSSHAVVGVAVACVLSKIYPKQVHNLEEYGYYIGNLRAIVGVHHPSDVEAGQELGLQICEYLKSNSSFKKSLRYIK